MKTMLKNINQVEGNGAMFCGRMTFEGSELTVSVNGRAKASLIETIMMFTDYFSEHYPDKIMRKLELFLKESDMHEGQKAWQTTHFN